MSSDFKTEPSSGARLAHSATAISVATLASRILGFVRDVLIAGVFGTGPAAQAFVIAFMIPNLLRDLVGEGAANSAFVPVLARSVSSDRKDFWGLSGVLLNWTLAISLLLSLLGILLAPAVVRLVAPGFLQEPYKFQLTIFLTKLLFPFIFLVALSAYAMAVLNTLGHFGLPAFGPCLLNLCMILSILWLCPHLHTPIAGLAWGVLLGGVLQFLIQWPLLSQKGFRYPGISFSHPGAKQVGRLLVPRMFGTAVYQLSVIADRAFASLSSIVGEGGVAALYFANRLFQFPLAMFGVSFATVALPTFSTQATDLLAFKRTLGFSLRSTLFVTLPATLGLLFLARPIVSVLFERGNFNPYSTSITSSALFYYTFGLLAYSGAKILVSAFHSLQDTRTPVRIAVASLVLNVVLNALLMFPMKIGGIALATSLSGCFDFLLLYACLRRKIGSLGGAELWGGLKQCALAGGVMGLVLGAGLQVPFLQQGWKGLLGLMTLGASGYFAVAVLLGIPEAEALWGWISRRK